MRTGSTRRLVAARQAAASSLSSRMRGPASALTLGEVIAAAAAQTYEDYVRSKILEPLSMTRTGFSYQEAQNGEIATGYQSRLSPMTPVFRLMLPNAALA
jgi:CubicO group peptidase (beta-lactamase class C family)